jgi:hypothetical protein
MPQQQLRLVSVEQTRLFRQRTSRDCFFRKHMNSFAEDQSNIVATPI